MPDTVTLLAQAKSVDPNRNIRVARSDLYPKQIWWAIACFIGLLTFLNLGAILILSRRRRRLAHLAYPSGGKKSAIDGESTRSSVNKISLRRVPLAIKDSFRILAYRVTLPIGGGHVLNGAEIGVTAGYIIALFTWEFINCNNVTTGATLDVAYWANRAGNIVASQLPLLIALSSKNNIVSLLTGISYQKLNVLHRSAARVLLVLVWVHIFGRVKQGIKGSSALTNPWMRSGVLTATAFTLLVLISSRPFRTRYYEIFFFSHIILVMIILIGAYYHIRGDNGFFLYLVPSFVLWAFDRTLRGLRVLWNNRSAYSSQASAPLEAAVEMLSPTMIRLSLSRNMTWRAGQSAFITMPGVSSNPFEAHPFNIATIPQTRFLRDAISAKSLEDRTSETTVVNDAKELVFLIRVKEGFTKRLQTVAEQSSALPLSVYVDGPYGSPPDVNAYESVILIAGGSGASYTLPLLQDIVYNARHANSGCRSVLFLWTVTHQQILSWISRSLFETLEAAPEALNIRIHLYVTRGKYGEDRNLRDDSSGEKSPTTSEAETLLQDKRVKLEYCRPDVVALLQEELACTQGSVSVNVAGPADLAADVRQALSYGIVSPNSVLKGGPNVTLHVETYGIT